MDRAGPGVRLREPDGRGGSGDPANRRHVRRPCRAPGRRSSGGGPVPDGRVSLSAYWSDVVSPWQTFAAGPPPPPGRIACDTLDSYVHNARLNYKVRDLTTSVTQDVNTHPINTQLGFGGGFFGEYTDIAVGSDNVFHALWTDSNNRQTVVWFYGFEFTPTPIDQEDIVTGTGSF